MTPRAHHARDVKAWPDQELHHRQYEPGDRRRTNTYTWDANGNNTALGTGTINGTNTSSPRRHLDLSYNAEGNETQKQNRQSNAPEITPIMRDNRLCEGGALRELDDHCVDMADVFTYDVVGNRITRAMMRTATERGRRSSPSSLMTRRKCLRRLHRTNTVRRGTSSARAD